MRSSRLIATLFGLLGLIVLADPASSTPPEYVAVHSQRRGDWDETIAVGVLDASPSLVRDALEDYAGASGPMPYLAEVRVLRVLPDGAVVYNRTSVPLIADYDYTLRIAFTELVDERGNDVVIVDYSAANEEGPPPRNDVVRVTDIVASWRLEPLDDGRQTRATYFVRTRRGAVVPPFLERWAASQMMPRIFSALYERTRALRGGTADAR